MNRNLLTAALLACSLPSLVLACDGDARQDQSWWTPVEVREAPEATVAELAQWAKARTAVAVDANLPQVRGAQGVIPGAVLLSSSGRYALTELPADKAARLVFYCASERCTASHQAARRALENGYTDVRVLAAGIKGWKAAAQRTEKVKPTS